MRPDRGTVLGRAGLLPGAAERHRARRLRTQVAKTLPVRRSGTPRTVRRVRDVTRDVPRVPDRFRRPNQLSLLAGRCAQDTLVEPAATNPLGAARLDGMTVRPAAAQRAVVGVLAGSSSATQGLPAAVGPVGLSGRQGVGGRSSCRRNSRRAPGSRGPGAGRGRPVHRCRSASVNGGVEAVGRVGSLCCAKQRAADTPGGLVLMGVRLYSPTIGRFRSIDPIVGGNANAYDYCTADPINCTDLHGRWGHKWFKRTTTHWGFFDKQNKHLVIRDTRPGIHWGGHKNRIEWVRDGWHYNSPDGQHHRVRKGVWEFTKAGGRKGWRGASWVGRGLGRLGRFAGPPRAAAAQLRQGGGDLCRF